MLMKTINLEEINVLNLNDQVFLYDILKYRWSNQFINLYDEKIPSFEEHVNYLCSGKYKKHYKVKLGDIIIGSVYIDCNNTWGIFILPSLLKIALKKYKKENTELYNNKQHLSYLVLKNLVKLNPNITSFYAKVNSKNTLSLNALLNAGFTPKTIIFETKSLNGRITNSNWPENE